MSALELSVAVAAHNRPLRLRWLLNALAEQTLDRGLWEVVVCHDSVGDARRQTDALLAGHPLAREGRLRSTSLPAGSAPPGANRNAAVALAAAPAVVFTDDDCRPPPEWLQTVAEAVRAHPGAVVQGPVAPDPDEAVMLRSSHPRTQAFGCVPRPWAECCNIAYPRALLERLGGFAEDMRTGEDAELAQRAARAGAPIVGDARMRTYHAVDEGGIVAALRGVPRWGDLALLIARHPGLRAHLFLRVFWKREHALLGLALAGGGLARRPGAARLAGIVIVAPWALARSNHHGPGIRGRARQILALPGWAVLDLAEIAVLARASARHRTLIM
jgi:glycosyltransferase involved in cell wall biosynthesis